MNKIIINRANIRYVFIILVTMNITADLLIL